MELKNAPEFNLDSVTKVTKGTQRKKKTAKATTADEFIKAKDLLDKALKDYPDFRDSRFLTAYLEQRATQQRDRATKKEEKDKAQKALNKMQKIENAEDKEKVLAIRSKDFVYNFWMLKNGKIYKEIICRPGLRIKSQKK